MRRWVGMFAQHALGTIRASRGGDAARLAGRRASHTLPRGAAVATARRSPRARWGGARAPPSVAAREYHSRWMVSTYGKEPGTPDEEYEGYEDELAAFEREGSPFALSMVDGGGEVDDAADLDEDDADAAASVATAAETNQPAADPLGNISKLWEEEEDDDDRLADDPREEHDALQDWAGTAASTSTSTSTASSPDEPLAAGLYLVGTPIGNLEDITLRALRVLRTADAVLAEDTRHTRRLLERYGIDARLVSYHAHNEMKRRGPLLERMRSGASLALVSDAGTPAVADPGADLAAACAAEGIRVVPVPGACAPAAAMGASGLPSESFTFVGFLPPKSGKRRKRLEKFAGAPGSVVAFVPPHKLVATLEDAAAVFGGERRCAVCREMTKVREDAPVHLFPAPSLSVWVFFSSPGARGTRRSHRARARVRSRFRAPSRSGSGGRLSRGL
jgi:16S rRNA (cytidine(1402)-2'-O)-methyltransferase